jgi:hypothetical protein
MRPRHSRHLAIGLLRRPDAAFVSLHGLWPRGGIRCDGSAKSLLVRFTCSVVGQGTNARIQSGHIVPSLRVGALPLQMRCSNSASQDHLVVGAESASQLVEPGDPGLGGRGRGNLDPSTAHARSASCRRRREAGRRRCADTAGGNSPPAYALPGTCGRRVPGRAQRRSQAAGRLLRSLGHAQPRRLSRHHREKGAVRDWPRNSLSRLKMPSGTSRIRFCFTNRQRVARLALEVVDHLLGEVAEDENRDG